MVAMAAAAAVVTMIMHVMQPKARNAALCKGMNNYYLSPLIALENLIPHGSRFIHHFLALGRRLDVAVVARLVAIKANVQLKDLCRLPFRR